MRHVKYAVLTLSLALCAAALGQQAQYRRHGAAVLNSLQATPGAVNKAMAVKMLCAATFHTRDERLVELGTKRAVCALYGQPAGRCPGSGYEIDHLISLELGGSNDVTNLWPQPVDTRHVVGFHTKDVVENAAHRAVCAGSISLQEAQHDIASDWYAFGLKYGFIGVTYSFTGGTYVFTEGRISDR